MDHRIEIVLRMIARDIRSAPRPNEIADEIGLSDFAFLRFYFAKRWGQSPASTFAGFAMRRRANFCPARNSV